MKKILLAAALALLALALSVPIRIIFTGNSLPEYVYGAAAVIGCVGGFLLMALLGP